jgi:type IV pilus assembly protein PilE
MNNKYKALGFTLVELLITLAIVGFLAAIAYPNYRQYLLRAHRTEGQTALQQTATRMERYFSNNSAYAPDMATLGEPATTANGYYTINIAPGACGNIGRCFQLTADAQGGQLDDADCLAITLDSTGAKAPADCW